MELFSHLELGLSVVLTFENLGYCFVGSVLGTAVGVLPGIGPVVTIALLLPLTFGMQPETALIFLAGIFYGAQYGGSTTAILMKLPGEASSVITCIDGHEMARKGQAGLALGIAAIGSFVAGTIATAIIALFAPALAEIALKFGPADNFSLMVLGLIGAIVLSRASPLKSIAMVLLGLTLGLIGTDVNTNDLRLTFGISELSDGISFVTVSMGLVGISEIIANLGQKDMDRVSNANLGRIYPGLKEVAQTWRAILRGTGIGAMLGILPGGGTALASFASYSVEKRLAKNPARFGKGAIEGVAGPESANNAAAQTSFIPLLTLGIPSGATTALMIGALTIQGITPGPQLAVERPGLFWGVIVSMWIGNLMLLVLNLPLIGLWAKIVNIPYRLLYPAILVFCAIGVYSLNNSTVDVVLMAVFGVIGFFLLKLDCDPAPLLLGFVLGPMMEEYFRRALLLTQGHPLVFVQRPISATLLGLCLILIVILFLPVIRRGRQIVFRE